MQGTSSTEIGASGSGNMARLGCIQVQMMLQ